MAPSASKVFISYNRADRDWAEWIAGAIESAGYEPIIQAWHFRPGENFVLRMQEAAEQTDFTIAVLSETYLKSEFTQPEWAAAFAQDPTGKKRKLIPVRVAGCDLTGMLAPIVYIDLIGLSESDAKRVLLDGLQPSGKPAQPQTFPGKGAESAISTAPFPPNVARLHGVSDLPPHYLPREADLAGLKQKLLAGGANVGVTGQSSAMGVQGMGGVGKTVLAAALARDLEVRHAFPDGIYWLTIGQKPDVLALQNQLLRQVVTDSKETLTTEQEAKDALREALEGRSALVVVDDVWTIDQADAFSVTAAPARLLITTRNQEILVGLGAEEHRIDVLLPSGALKMLAEWVGWKSVDNMPPEAADVAKECGYLPLALAMIGAMIRLRPTAWKDALVHLRRADLEAIKRNFPGYPYPDLLRAIEVSVHGLESADRERYLNLAVFPEDQSIPEGPLAILWQLEEMDTRDCMTHFVARSLATWATDGSSLILHDLQRDLIVKRREKDLPSLHLRLVEAWDALPKLPDVYAWRWIAYHMVGAGHNDDLRQLLFDFNYLQAKLAASDTNALIADYDYLADEEDLCLVQSAIRLSANVLARDTQQLAGQLTGRLLGNTSPGIQSLLKQAAEWKAWLRPLAPSLTAPGGPLIRTLEGHTGIVNAVAVTPDGRRAVSASWDQTLRLWDLSSGQTLRMLEGHTGEVSAVAVTPDGRRVVSASYDQTLRLWDLESSQTLRTLEGHTKWINAVAVTPDGRRAVSASNDRTLRLWDMETGQTLRTLEGHTSSIFAMALTPDGRRAVSASSDRTLRLWDLESGQTIRLLEGHTNSVNAVAVTPDGRRAVSASDDRTLRLWDLGTGQTLRTLEGHTKWINAVAVTPDGRRAVSASGDQTLRLWDLESGQTIRLLEGHTKSVNAVAVTPDGRRAVSASDDRTLRLWNLGTGQTLRMLEGHADIVNAVAVTPDGRRAVSASSDRTLRLWDLETGQTLRTLKGHTGGIGHVVVASDGRRAVSASYDQTLRLWDLGTGQTLRTLEGHTYGIFAVALTPDGRRAMSASSDYTLRLWDLESGQTIRLLEGHTDRVLAVAVTPDGRRAVSASWDHTLRLWDLQSGQTIRLLEGHTDWVTAMAVTADGRRAVSASNDRTLRVWHLEGRKEIATFTGEDGMRSCAIAQDGWTIVVGDESGQVHFLRLEGADKTKPSPADVKVPVLLRERQSTDKPKEGGRWRFWKRPWGRSR
jgi:WD40 repeat protein